MTESLKRMENMLQEINDRIHNMAGFIVDKGLEAEYAQYLLQKHDELQRDLNGKQEEVKLSAHIPEHTLKSDFKHFELSSGLAVKIIESYRSQEIPVDMSVNKRFIFKAPDEQYREEDTGQPLLNRDIYLGFDPNTGITLKFESRDKAMSWCTEGNLNKTKKITQRTKSENPIMRK